MNPGIYVGCRGKVCHTRRKSMVFLSLEALVRAKPQLSEMPDVLSHIDVMLELLRMLQNIALITNIDNEFVLAAEKRFVSVFICRRPIR